MFGCPTWILLPVSEELSPIELEYQRNPSKTGASYWSFVPACQCLYHLDMQDDLSRSLTTTWKRSNLAGSMFLCKKHGPMFRVQEGAGGAGNHKPSQCLDPSGDLQNQRQGLSMLSADIRLIRDQERSSTVQY